MAGRVQQDAFIDDSDESCPLCVEEFDLSDKNFRPCPCGYQVCQFCYNNIKNHMNGLCPACRRPYDDQSIEWKIVSPEEQKADIALQARKKAMARKKETEQKQVETTNRKNLAGLRVVQKNLVYVVGLSQKSSEEEFLRTLRGPQYFGQYGKITKIVVSKAKEGQTGNNSIGVYVTFENKEDAARCIAAVDGSQNLDRPLRAQYGTTKYCSAFLRNETCGNRNCTFLHETGEDNDSFSRQDLSSMNALSTQRPAQQASSSRPNQQAQPQAPPQQAPQSISAASQPGPSKGVHDETMSRSDSGDGSALPSSASWAARNAQSESRKSSKPASVAASSPMATSATISSQPSETRQAPAEPEPPLQPSEPTTQASTIVTRHRSLDSPNALEAAMKTVSTSTIKFVFDRSMYDPDQLKYFESCPPLFDPHGGLIRYRMAKAQEQERQKQEEERNVLGAISAAEEDDEAPASGSLQLGGEPEPQDSPQDNSGRMSAQQRSAIQPPFGSSSAFPFSGPSFQASNAANLTRTLTPQQQQHLSLLRSRSSRQSPVSNSQFQQGYTGNTSLHHHQPSNPFQMQNQTFSTAQGHARQASRFTFANDSASASTAVKPVANPQLIAQQSAMMPSNQSKQYQNQPAQQSNVHGNHFYSGVQGPPPGLKSSGTPPISGGGMFGQGHGFANAMGGSAGFGNNVSSKNSNDELMRELLRTRTGSTNGLGPDVGKRESKFPFAPQPMTSDAPVPSLLSSLYGSQLGTHHGYQDHNLQKQKKKGKKHRHANTSSSGGGGIVDLADPSILQARMHHGAAGQGQFGAQGQEPPNVSRQQSITPLLPPPDLPAALSSTKPNAQTTPTPAPVPPGLSLPQDFPPLVAPTAPPASAPRLQRKVTSGATIKPVIPVLPTPSARPTAIPKERQPEEQTNLKEQPSTTSLSPATGRGAEADISRELVPNTDAAPVSSKEAEKDAPAPPKTANKKQRPGKIDITAAQDASKKMTEAENIPAAGMEAVSRGKSDGSRSFEPSQPPTPRTATSQVSVPSAVLQSQPRTIRIPSMPKAEASPPGIPGPSSRQASRRPSLASNHRPDTPASERISDTVSIASNTMSRANSPPPSKVGSAPVRQMTKNQQKKERQARAKQAEQAEDSPKIEEAPAKVGEVEQAPIVGRKKKTKRERTQGTADSTPTVTRPTSPVQKEEIAEEKVATGPVTPVKHAKKGVSKLAAEVKEPETPSSPATPATGEQPKPLLTATAFCQSMLDASEIRTAAREIFNPVAGLNHRFETVEPAFADNHDTLVSDDHHRLLEQGQAIQIEKGPNNHMVIFPDRRVLQGLTASQASRYLELRKQALSNGDMSSHQALEGLIPAPPPMNVAAVSANSQRGSKQKILTNKFYTPTAQPERADMQKFGSVLSYDEQGLPNRKPTMSLAEAERELLASKKETEGLEKKLNALLKKNRRLLFGNAH